VVFTPLTAGQTSYAVQYFNEALERTELLGRGGGGAYAIQFGYELSESSGLTLAYTEGSTVADGPRRKAAGTIALAPSTWSFLYVTQGGTLTAATQFFPSPAPSLPAASVFLGRVHTDLNSIQEIDYSGRFTLHGNLLLRETADTGEPGDTPPAGARFYTKVSDGTLYLWDGEAYHLVSAGDALALANDAIVAVETRLTLVEYYVGLMMRTDAQRFGLQAMDADLSHAKVRALGSPFAAVL
jgi:hypothetical protein